MSFNVKTYLTFATSGPLMGLHGGAITIIFS